MKRSYGTLGVLAGVLLAFGVARADGQTECSPDGLAIEWTCDADGRWLDPACWDSVGIPASGDDVRIDRASDPTVLVDAVAEFCALDILDGLLLQAPGEMRGYVITIGPAPATMEIRSGTGSDAVVYEASLDNQGSLMIGRPGDDWLEFNWHDIGSFDNAGTVEVTSNTAAYFYQPDGTESGLSNSGTLTVDSGYAEFSFATFSNEDGGLIEARGGGGLNVRGSVQNDTGARIEANGEGSEVRLERYLDFDFHDLYSAGTIEATDGGAVDIDSQGEGRVTNGSPGEIGASSGGTLTLRSTHLTGEEGSTLFAHTGGSLRLADTDADVPGFDLTNDGTLGLSGNVTINVSGELTIPEDGRMELECCDQPNVEVNGVVIVAGEMDIHSGELHLADPLTVKSGGRASLNEGGLDARGSLTVNAPDGRLEIHGDSYVNVGGALTIEGGVYVRNGSLTADDTLTVTAPDGLLEINGGEVGAEGPFTNQHVVLATGGEESSDIDAEFTNAADAIFRVEGWDYGTTLWGPLFDNQGLVEIMEDAWLRIESDAITQQGAIDVLQGSLDAPGGMVNEGTITMDDAWIDIDPLTNAVGAEIIGGGYIEKRLYNEGLVQVSDASLELAGTETWNDSTGILEAQSYGTLRISSDGQFTSTGILRAQGDEAQIEIDADTALIGTIELVDGGSLALTRVDCTITSGLLTIPDSSGVVIGGEDDPPATIHANVSNAGYLGLYWDSVLDGSLTNAAGVSCNGCRITGKITNHGGLYLQSGADIPAGLNNADGAGVDVSGSLTGGEVFNEGNVGFAGGDVGNQLTNTSTGSILVSAGTFGTTRFFGEIENDFDPKTEEAGSIGVFIGRLELHSPNVTQRGEIWVGLLGTLVLQHPLTNEGNIVLEDGGAISGPGMLTNLGEISSRDGHYGQIDTNVDNEGIIDVELGSMLEFDGIVTNRGSIYVDPAAILQFDEGAFFNGSGDPKDPGGSIEIAPQGMLVCLKEVFTNRETGTVSLEGGVIVGEQGITNRADAEIWGFGTIDVVDDTVTNHGLIELYGDSTLIGDLNNTATGTLLVRNQELLITGQTSNEGTIETLEARIIYEGGLNSGGELLLSDGEMTVGTLQIDPTGVIRATGGVPSEIVVTGAMVNRSSDPSLWETDDLTLRFNGWVGDGLTMEAASEDRGPCHTDFTDNFALGKLSVGPNAVALRLEDVFDNAPGPAEAVYTRQLLLHAGTTLDLESIPLYYLELENLGGMFVNGEPIRVRVPDLDDDGNVDLVDFSMKLFGCFRGPGQPIDLSCEVVDLDCDADVDLSDFADLQAAFTGS